MTLHMGWDGDTPTGYDAFQTSCLSTRSATAALAVINGATQCVAETTLNITQRYSGDNYQVRATLQNPQGACFDTGSCGTANSAVAVSGIAASQTLVAWKRYYIEYDRMYKKGATIVSDNLVPGPNNTTFVYVDSTADFAVGTDAVVFWKGGSNLVHVVGKNESSLLVSELTNSVSRFYGIRPVEEPDAYELDFRYLKNAYGEAPDGSDGGAFIEFKPSSFGNDKTPKYAEFPPLLPNVPRGNVSNSIVYAYGKYWSNTAGQYDQNSVYVLVSNRINDDNSQGISLAKTTLCNVFVGTCPTVHEREKTVPHEIGHSLGLLSFFKGLYGYIDTKEFFSNHEMSGPCIMSYYYDPAMSVEFSYPCLLLGSNGMKMNSLRCGEER